MPWWFLRNLANQSFSHICCYASLPNYWANPPTIFFIQRSEKTTTEQWITIIKLSAIYRRCWNFVLPNKLKYFYFKLELKIFWNHIDLIIEALSPSKLSIYLGRIWKNINFCREAFFKLAAPVERLVSEISILPYSD